MSVSMIPGSTTATRMLNILASCARPSLSASNAHFDAAYAVSGGDEIRPPTELTLMMQTTLSLSHFRHDRLNTAHDAKVVGFHKRPEFRERQFFDSATVDDSCIVDEDVDRAVCALDAGDGIPDRAIRVYIHHRNLYLQAFRFRSFRKLRGALRVSHGRMNRVAGASERQCDCQADAFVCAGDQCVGHAQILTCAEATISCPSPH